MVITTEILDKLSAEAKANERLRMNLDLRTSAADQSQRMLNALEPDTQVPIHRHPKTSETFVVLRGSIRQLVYDELGNITEDIVLKAGVEPNTISIPKGVWHRAVCLEPGTILFEAKDGAFEPRRDEDILIVN